MAAKYPSDVLSTPNDVSPIDLSGKKNILLRNLI
jgi:hypothetical protein